MTSFEKSSWGNAFGEFPLPLAQLQCRAQNAKSPAARQREAWSLWKAALRLWGAAVLAWSSPRERHDPRLRPLLERLARPTLENWWELWQQLLVLSDSSGDVPTGRLREFLCRTTPPADFPLPAELNEMLAEMLGQRTESDAGIQPAAVFERLLKLRRSWTAEGHTGVPETAISDRASRVLLAGIVELVEHLAQLAPVPLWYVEEVRREAQGAWSVHLQSLSQGDAPQGRVLMLPASEIDRLPYPRQVYLQRSEVSQPKDDAELAAGLVSLHPWMSFDAESREFFFLHVRRGQLRPEYLSYQSGREIHGQPSPDELASSLSAILGEEVAAGAWDRWAQTGLAEEPPEHPARFSAVRRKMGDFELVTRIGKGGMGVVYRAWQNSVGRQVALKLLMQSGNPTADARFAREIRSLGRVEHPNLVKIYTSGTDADQWFYVMELVEGATLGAITERLGAKTPSVTDVDLQTWQETLNSVCQDTRAAEMPVSQSSSGSGLPQRPAGDTKVLPVAAAGGYVSHIVELLRQTAEAAHALHEAGVVHRDIKAGNIMVTADGRRAVLMDLGLAQLADETEHNLTRTRQFVGTLRYASPEQVLGARNVTRTSDVYSLGATLWELLTLRPLYGVTDGTPTPELMEWIQFKQPDGIRKHNPELPRDLEAVVMKCLEKNPAQRYNTAQELADDLGRWQRGDRVVAKPLTPWYWLKKRAVRHRRPLLGAAVTAACVTAALVLWPKSQPVPPVALLDNSQPQDVSPPPAGENVSVELLPGLSGTWWFEESPWLAPFVRSPLEEDLGRMPTHTAYLPTSDGSLPNSAPAGTSAWLAGAGVAGIRQKLLDLVTSRSGGWELPGGEPALLEALVKISQTQFKKRELVESLRQCLQRFEQSTPKEQRRAEASHTLAVLEHRLAELGDDGENRRTIAREHYQEALRQYEKDEPLRYLCLSDLGRLETLLFTDHAQAAEHFAEAARWPGTPAAFRVELYCSQGEALFRAGKHHQDDLALEAGLRLAEEQLPPHHPLLAHAHESYAWNLMDQWRVEEAREHFRAAGRIRREAWERGDKLSQIHVFHNRHGEAIALRYTGQQAGARIAFDALLKDLRQALVGAQSSPESAGLRERLQNSLERRADCELYEGAASLPQALDLGQAAAWYAESRELADKPGYRVAMGYKRAIALALDGETDLGVREKQEADRGIVLGAEESRVNHLRRVAAAVLVMNTQGPDDGCQALRKLLERFRNNPGDPDRQGRDTLELHLLSAELLLHAQAARHIAAKTSVAEPPVPVTDVQYLDELLKEFPESEQMQRWFRRYYDVIAATVGTAYPERVARHIRALRKLQVPPEGQDTTEVLFQLFDKGHGLAVVQRPDGETVGYALPFGAEEVRKKAPSLDLPADLKDSLQQLTHKRQTVVVQWADPILGLTDESWPFAAENQLPRDPGGKLASCYGTRSVYREPPVASQEPGGWTDRYRRQWAVIVGVNYGHLQGAAERAEVPALRTAENDAQAVYDQLLASYGYTPQTTRLLLGGAAEPEKRPTGENIRRLFGDGFLGDKNLVSKDDSALFFFAGHGNRRETTGVSDKYVGLLYPQDVHILAGKGVDTVSCLRIDELLGYLRDYCAARHKLVILDSCHSGEVFNFQAHRSSGVNRGFRADLFRQPVFQAIAAARASQTAADADETGQHSPVTRALLDALSDGPGGGQKLFTASELFSYIPSRVEQMKGIQQAPQGGWIAGEGDFYFFRAVSE